MRNQHLYPEKRVKNPLIGLLASLILIPLLSGCPSTPTQTDAGLTGAELDAMSGARTAGIDDRRGSPLDDPSSPLYQRVIYFGYDATAIDPKYANLLRAHADYLARTSNATVVLEGHTDERGTREYNLALGESRAEAVRSFLVAEGVPAQKIRTLSYGEERPAEIGSSERAYSLSRRVELVY
ncbi:peptidoglycan-associated lipoprotein Pal [Thiorhodovibrio frisius]|uniref:Peptidoglycan-associated lipoprotein n=1 Tax=Thiorhodovibrio frisius TaxID=631362 RepID=H8Z828_9GAMM|nr:peptidoglycan-associated lipoprotein Pal [Thiorhodovibrio frisius]EIC19963.1 peptidoglycan-associated lipoprotein [Thiorhodovibrio frisius]WPL20692.1 15 kDa peptidoglycan-associated lipoprotein [Thiorhodovibrio frisius]